MGDSPIYGVVSVLLKLGLFGLILSWGLVIAVSILDVDLQLFSIAGIQIPNHRLSTRVHPWHWRLFLGIYSPDNDLA